MISALPTHVVSARRHSGGASNRPRLRQFAVVVTVLAVALGVAGTVLDAGAAAPSPTPQAQPALEWLAAQLAANGGSMPGFTPGSSDWGLTADAVLAFAAAGQSNAPAAVTATDLLTGHASEYTTWTAGADTVREAGATGKVLLALRSMGRPSIAQGVDLESELRSLVVTSGPEAGRFSDRVPDPTWNSANGFGQALSMLGLAFTDGGMPPLSVTFLLAQQCPSGGFRLTYSTTAGCAADTQADTDATAMALQALLAATPRSTDVAASLERGTAWLISQQAADGSWGGTGPTAGANSNSTGLISQYLRAAGATAAADRGAAWIATCCQITPANSTGTPAAADAGAIAYNTGSLAAALNDGVTDQTGDQWRRATTQAVLAFGLSPYGPQDVEPLPPVTTTTSTSTTIASTTTTSTTTSTISPPTTSAPEGTATTTAVDASVEADQLAGAAEPNSYSHSGSSAGSSSGSRLATTGTDPALLMGSAVLLLVVGAMLGTAGRRGVR